MIDGLLLQIYDTNLHAAGLHSVMRVNTATRGLCEHKRTGIFFFFVNTHAKDKGNRKKSILSIISECSTVPIIEPKLMNESNLEMTISAPNEHC